MLSDRSRLKHIRITLSKSQLQKHHKKVAFADLSLIFWSIFFTLSKIGPKRWGYFWFAYMCQTFVFQNLTLRSDVLFTLHCAKCGLHWTDKICASHRWLKEDSWWSNGRLVGGGGDCWLRESAHQDEKRSGFQAKRPDRPSCGLHRRQIKVSGLTRWLVWGCGGREGELARWSPACVARRWQPRGNFHREGDSRLASCGARRRLMAPPQLLTLSVPQACQPSQGTVKASIQVQISKMHKKS